MNIVAKQKQMETERFAFRGERKLATIILPVIAPAVEVFGYFCACGSRMRKPSAGSSGLGTWRCPVDRSKKVARRERMYRV